jgi:transposase
MPARPSGTHRPSINPDNVRKRMAKKAKKRRIAGVVDTHSGTHHAALRRLAARYHVLTTEIADADTELAVLVKQARPDLLAIRGVGIEAAAQLLSTCGDKPRPAALRSSIRLPVRGVPGPGLQRQD